ncbi:MAG: hypothetical protein KDB92_10945, partial [Chitinophagaceae bacterium]|nr:hypothetical protein [Chitinophagaceae bacterium]
MNYKCKKAKFLLLSASVLLISFHVFSQTNTWTDGNPSNSNWRNGQNWSLNHEPTSTEDVLINSNATIDVNTTTEIKSLKITGNVIVTLQAKGNSDREITINNNGSAVDAGSTLNIVGNSTHSLTLSFKSGGTRTMSIAGVMNVNITSNDPGILNTTNSATTVTGTINNNGGTITSTASNLSFSASGIYNHQTDGNAIPVATWAASSDCNITGIVNTGFYGLNQSFGNLTWDCAGETSGFNFVNLLTSVQGDFTIGNTNTYGLFMGTTNNSNYTLTIGGNLTINDNAWFGITNGDNITATVNVGGNFSMSGIANNSTFFDFHVATGSSISLAKVILNVAGNFSQSGGLFDFASGYSDVTNFTELK